MAGYGRNVEALALYFDRCNIELLDGSQRAMEEAGKERVGARHCCLLHDFKRDYSQYGLVLGVWALCYLQPDHMHQFLRDASAAGRLILIEPIKNDEDR